MHHFTLNFGPQHPAAHGVLRLILELEGELLCYADAHIGLLHRGTEKLLETKNVLQGLPYFDRLDYVAMLSQEYAYTLAVEQFFSVQPPLRVLYLRIIFVELTRILNHLFAITTHALDVGALTPLLWAFEEREKIFEFYERFSGARMHANLFRPGGFLTDVPSHLLQDLYTFIASFSSRVDELEYLLTDNKIWKQRLIGIGSITQQLAVARGITGILLRSTGIPYDLRSFFFSSQYQFFEFAIPVGIFGDSYDRYLLRIAEMRQSMRIIMQALTRFPAGLYFADNHKLVTPAKRMVRTVMEALIHHFKLYTEGNLLARGHLYLGIESPKGEFGIFIIGNNTAVPFRCKIRSPGYFHLQALSFFSGGHLLADLVTLIGTIDIVFGEIDR